MRSVIMADPNKSKDGWDKADIVGKLWVHVPKGGYLLTRALLPLALIALVCLLLPLRKRREPDGLSAFSATRRFSVCSRRCQSPMAASSRSGERWNGDWNSE